LLQKNFVCDGKGSGFGGGKEVSFGCYQTFGNLTLDFGPGQASGYRRVLNLDQALTTVDLTVAGNRFQRTSFVSLPQGWSCTGSKARSAGRSASRPGYRAPSGRWLRWTATTCCCPAP
jgi:alpha-L-fucosidase 2